ncbi:MAG: hypothetical protein ABJF11_04845 [Reichenbachiella sp.]|uniref:hypothetical protein n=1 Tax=Reichenbachiella sp. TaxID=2184521 RepID=UPI00326644D8
MGINKYSRDFEAYFSGSMSETDRILFEGRVESDPLLKSEFERQNDIVEGLKAHRTAELKTRLNNISVEPTLIGTLMQGSMMKTLTYGVTSLMIASGAYFFYNKEAAIKYHIDALDSKNDYTLGSQMSPAVYGKLDYRYEGNMQMLDYVEASPVLKKRDFKEARLDNTQNITFSVPEVNPSHEETFDGMGVDINALDRIEQVTGISEFDKVNIQTINSRKYNFHYRLEENRLFLYGKFSESPYEIIEISTPGNKKLFFYYQGDFYQLRKNASSITPLSKIENRELIDELGALKVKG